MKITIISVFLFLSFSSLAQGYKLSGKLTNDASEPISYASVALSNPKDTSTIQFTVANEKGRYEIKPIMPGDYLLVIACVGFEVTYISIIIDNQNLLKNIKIKSSDFTIKEVMVRANKIPVLFNGDTIIYNSNSFKTQSNATVEDLLKKLPGVRVNKDGSVSAEGQNITKVLINGKEFFGGNVEAATKNIDASLVDKVEVIDKKIDEDELEDGDSGNEREKVINLVLNEEKTQGYFGTIRAGYGNDNFYDGHGNINFFKDQTQLSIIGGSNNINENLYGWEEMNLLQSFDINPFTTNSMFFSRDLGVKTNLGIGANIHAELKEKTKVDVSYILTDNSFLSIAEADAELYINENSLFGNTYEKSDGGEYGHMLNARIRHTLDSMNSITIRMQYSNQNQNSISRSRTYNFFKTDTIINSGVTLDDENNDDEKLSTKIIWVRQLKKEGSLFTSLYMGNSSVSNQHNNYFKTIDFGLLPFPENENPILVKNLKTSQKTIAATYRYTKKISSKIKLNQGVNFLIGEYNHSFDWLPTGQDKLQSNSPVGDVDINDINIYAGIEYELDSFTTINFTPTISLQIENRAFQTDKFHKFDFDQLLFMPNIYIRTNKPHQYNGYFSLRGRLVRPNISWVLPIIDNSDPYRTNIGNIELKNATHYNNNYRIQKLFGLGKSVYIQGFNQLRIKPPTSHIIISEDNYATSSFESIKNRLYTDQTFGVSWPINKLKANLGFDLNFSYGRSFSVQNEEDLITKIRTLGFGPNLQFNQFDLWSFDIDYSLNSQSGSVNNIDNNNFILHEIASEFILNPTKKLEWSTTAEISIYGANNASGSLTIPVVSSEILYTIDKKNHWTLGIKAFDIFDQNMDFWRWWANNNYTQTQYNSIQQYFMGTITYKIKK